MSEQADGGRSELWRSLQALSREEGVWRPNLVKLLEGELLPLQHVWRIGLQSAGDDIRKAVSSSLHALIVQLEPRDARQPLKPEQRKKQYRHAVLICFNLIDIPELRNTKLQERRSWLAREERGVHQIAVTTSQRDLNHAIDQIEKMLTRPDYSPAEDQSEDAVGPSHLITPELEVNSAREPKKLPRRIWRRTTIAAIATVAMVASIVIAVVALTASDDPLQPSDDGILRATLLTVGNGANLSAAFPRELSNQASEYANYLKENIKTTDYDERYREQLSRGAYATADPSNGPFVVRIELEGLADAEVTVVDVRLDDLKRTPIPLDTLVYASLGGQDQPRKLYFSLDQPVPLAMRDYPIVGDPNGEFRNDERIGLEKGKKETLALNFAAQTTAATFNIAIDYESAGTIYTQHVYLTEDKQPFRVAPLVCDIKPRSIMLGTKLDDLEKVRKYRYDSVYAIDLNTGVQSDYGFIAVNPTEFAGSCLPPTQ